MYIIGIYSKTNLALSRRPYKCDRRHCNREEQKELLKCKKTVIKPADEWSSPAITEGQLKDEDIRPILTFLENGQPD